MHMSREARVTGPLATSCDPEPAVDKRHFAVSQGTWPLSACIALPLPEVHAAEKSHLLVIDDYQESDQKCGLSVVGGGFVAFVIHPPICLGDVSFCLVGFFKGQDRLCCLPCVESTKNLPSRVSSSLP